MGVWPSASDGTDVNALDVSPCGRYAVTADDGGFVKLFAYPVLVENAPHRAYRGHAGHVTMVRFNCDGTRVVSAGGRDRAAFQFSLRRRPEPAPAPPPRARRWLPLDASGKAFGFREPREGEAEAEAEDEARYRREKKRSTSSTRTKYWRIARRTSRCSSRGGRTSSQDPNRRAAPRRPPSSKWTRTP